MTTKIYHVVCPCCGKHTPIETFKNIGEQEDFIVSERECRGGNEGIPETRKLSILDLEDEGIYEEGIAKELLDILKKRTHNMIRLGKLYHFFGN